jgi:hypothetical protein
MANATEISSQFADQVSISPTFYEQLLRKKILKAQKDSDA